MNHVREIIKLLARLTVADRLVFVLALSPVSGGGTPSRVSNRGKNRYRGSDGLRLYWTLEESRARGGRPSKDPRREDSGT